MASTGAVRRFLKEHPKEFDPRKYLRASTEGMKEICKARFEAFGTAGRAVGIVALPLSAMAERYLAGSLPAAAR